jgi:hypothetical protein
MEGYDFNVITWVLRRRSRAHFLKVEYNWVDPWAKQNLADTIDLFKPKYLFAIGQEAFTVISGVSRIDFRKIHSWSIVAWINYIPGYPTHSPRLNT